MDGRALSKTIIGKARSLGASLAGIAAGRFVLKTPSHRNDASAQQRFQSGSFLVLALEHPASNPLLDGWSGRGGTPGNRELQRIGKAMQNWLKSDYEIASRILPYHVKKGGIFLKEAAVMAGLGVIGRNNLLITPQFGANVRLRALFLDKDIPPNKAIPFAPCDDCSMPCRKACPQNAFKSGTYQRSLCNIRMLQDEANQKNVSSGEKVISVIAYCRACEWACPVSRGILSPGA